MSPANSARLICPRGGSRDFSPPQGANVEAPLGNPKVAIHSPRVLSHRFPLGYSSPSLTGWNLNTGCLC